MVFDSEWALFDNFNLIWFWVWINGRPDNDHLIWNVPPRFFLFIKLDISWNWNGSSASFSRITVSADFSSLGNLEKNTFQKIKQKSKTEKRESSLLALVQIIPESGNNKSGNSKSQNIGNSFKLIFGHFLLLKFFLCLAYKLIFLLSYYW